MFVTHKKEKVVDDDDPFARTLDASNLKEEEDVAFVQWTQLADEDDPFEVADTAIIDELIADGDFDF